MAELNKAALTSENNNSFPNNNTGFITPDLLRTFNQNMIDSMVDEITYNADSASFSSSIALLKDFSSSLDNTYATDAQLSASVAALSSSIAITDLAQSSSIAALQVFSSSLDATFATDAQLSASASTLQNDINTKLATSSFNQYTQSASTNVSASINAATSSLSASIAVTTNNLDLEVNGKLDSGSFNAYTASQTTISASFNQRIDALDPSGSAAAILSLEQATASLYSYTASNDLKVDALIDKTGSYATTGSNTFNGSQNVIGDITASNIRAVSASFEYVLTVFETASVIYSSGSNQLGDELTDVQTLSGSVKVQGDLSVNGVNVLSSSVASNAYLLTSSFNTYTQSVSTQIAGLGMQINTRLTTASFNAYTQSAASGVSASINSATQSLSSSIAVTTNFLDLKVNQKLDSSSFNVYTQSNDSIVNALVAATSSYVTEAESGSFVTDVASGFNLNEIVVTEGNGNTSTLIINNVASSSYAALALTASYALNATGVDTGSLVTTSSFNSFTASYEVASQSFDVRINALETGSAPAGTVSSSQQIVDLGFLQTSSFNAYTQSVSTDIANLSSSIVSINSATSSYITNSQTASMTVLSASFAETASYALNVPAIDSGSFATTGSNTFIGNQIISGNLNISGSITATSASFQYVETIFETASTIYSSGSNQFGDASNDVQTLYGSVNAVNRFTASGLNYPIADNGAKSFVQTDGNGNLSLQYVDAIFETVRNMSGGTLLKGTPVYISGSTGDNGNAYPSDASDSAKMPAIYILGEDLNAGDTGIALVGGLIEGVNTTGYPAGTIIYVAEGGGWTDSRPTGSASIVQVLGVVQKEGVGGQGVVINQLEATLPNIQTGYVWVGNGTNQPVAVSTASLATDTGAYLTTASFNAYTSSESSNVSASINSATSSLSASLTTTINGLSGKTGSYATTGSNIFVGNQTISGSTILSGSVAISGSNPTIQSGSLSGSLISNLGDIYTGSNNANFIVTLGSASMASLLSGGTTNANTLYIVI